MEQKTLPVIYSEEALERIKAICEYGAETFSSALAEKFVSDLIIKLDGLNNTYLQHTECRYLPTTAKQYRGCSHLFLTW